MPARSDCADFTGRLLRWFDAHGRKTLPWQRDREPYRIWVAEIMLQQTQVNTVIPYYREFMARFPSLEALARCPLDELLHVWSGLGYYARARNLHAAAKRIMAEHNGEFPRQFEQALALPGIGRSTAGAILAFAHGQRHPILDGNVKRVLARHRAIQGSIKTAATQTELWRLAERLTPATRVGDYAQAIMDLGATLCARARPQCPLCPVRRDCRARLQGDPSAFPQRPARTVVRRRRAVTMLIIQNQRAELLLVKRPPSGIWGGLWSLPECPPAPLAGAAQWCQQQLGLAIKTGRPRARIRHAFTHFDLDILPLPATLADACVQSDRRRMDAGAHLWYNPASPTRVGLPAAVNRILRML